MRVVHKRPETADLEFSQKIMDLTMPVRLQKLRDFYSQSDLSGVEGKQRLLEQRTELFLNVFNSNWKRDSLIHCCYMGCPCGGLPGPELASLASELFVEIILSSRPTVPALSRWLKCSKAAKWFLRRPQL